MESDEFEFDAFGATIFYRVRKPDECQGVVVLVHGFGEHSGRYLEHVIPMLLETNMAVVSYDNIGHGKSGGKRGHCPNYGALLDILNVVTVRAAEKFPDLPLFLYGHSMGGNLVLNYALRHKTQVAGIVATSPYLRLAFQPPKWKMAVGRLLLKVWPSLTMRSGLDPSGISRVREEVEKYKADPLVHDKVSPMYSFPVMSAGAWAIAHAERLAVKTLLLHGMADPIIDSKGTEEFHQKSNKTELKLFEGGYHELHHDECREEMLQIVQNWLKEQL